MYIILYVAVIIVLSGGAVLFFLWQQKREKNIHRKLMPKKKKEENNESLEAIVETEQEKIESELEETVEKQNTEVSEIFEAEPVKQIHKQKISLDEIGQEPKQIDETQHKHIDEKLDVQKQNENVVVPKKEKKLSAYERFIRMHSENKDDDSDERIDTEKSVQERANPDEENVNSVQEVMNEEVSDDLEKTENDEIDQKINQQINEENEDEADYSIETLMENDEDILETIEKFKQMREQRQNEFADKLDEPEISDFDLESIFMNVSEDDEESEQDLQIKTLKDLDISDLIGKSKSEVDEIIKNLDPKMQEIIVNEILGNKFSDDDNY